MIYWKEEKMTELMFCFDVEDFTSNSSADAIRDMALLFTRQGIKADFCLVGLVAKQLVNWGRQDVLKALEAHNIHFHSYSHSIHPTINEYTDIDDYNKAYSLCFEQEFKGLEIVKSVTGKKEIYAAVPPGESKSYVAMYAYSDMGIKAYCDTACDTEDGKGAYYCNLFNMDYYVSFETMFYNENAIEVADLLDNLSKRKKAIIYNHPNAIVYREFWDKINYDKENKAEFGKWQESTKRKVEEIDLFMQRVSDFLTKIKKDTRFNLTTINKVLKSQNYDRERIITPQMLPIIKAQLKENFSPLSVPDSFSISDVFLAVVEFFQGKKEYKAGKVFGFLSEPYQVEEEIIVTDNEIRETAKYLNISSFLPEKISVGGKTIGPTDFLFAALDVLCSNKKKIIIKRRKQLNSLEILPKLKELSLKGTWIHSENFEDRFLSDRLRLQAWTLRFEVDSQ